MVAVRVQHGNYLKVKVQSINWYCILSSIILTDTSKEGLGEEETRKPVIWWFTFVEPELKEVESLQEVVDVAAEWFEGRVGAFRPHGWNSAN